MSPSIYGRFVCGTTGSIDAEQSINEPVTRLNASYTPQSRSE